MESGGPSWEDEEVVYEEELPPAYVEDRVDRLGTWSRAAAGLAVLAAAVAVIALVFALRASDDGEQVDPAEIEQVERQVLELSNDLTEVREEAAQGAALEERVDELATSIEDLDARLTRVTTGARTLSGRLDDMEEAGDERDARLDRAIDGMRDLAERVDELEEGQ